MSDFGPLIRSPRLFELLDAPDLRILDCRFDLKDPLAGHDAWRSGHIPGASFLDLEKDLSGDVGPTTGRHPLPDSDALARTFGACGIDSQSRVVVYDAGNGGIAARAWWLLRWLGHSRVALLEQGYSGWVAADLPVTAEETVVSPATFVPRPRPGQTISTADVVRHRESGLVLVDARERARYLGEHEPIDAVAGRVPGARNLPFADLLDSDGRFKSPAAIRKHFEEVLGAEARGDWVSMCGSGVTACHLALSASVAGYPEPRLYIGSFSEWIRDSERPVASGPEPAEDDAGSAESA